MTIGPRAERTPETRNGGLAAGTVSLLFQPYRQYRHVQAYLKFGFSPFDV